MTINSKRIIRIAIIGAGRVAQHYKSIFDSNVVSDFKVVGVCDIKLVAAENLARHWQCESFTDLEEMLNKCLPDLLLILTPSGLHYSHALTALKSGYNVLTEKPVTLITKQAEELIALAKQRGLMFGVAFQNRLNPAIKCLREAVGKERFGQITTATIRLRWCRYQEYYQDEWHGTWSQDGGVINQQAIHHIDALNWLMGPVDEVCATMGNRLNILEAEDTMVGLLRFKSGAMGTIEATTAARPCDVEASLSIIGEGGVAVVGGIALNKIETWQFVEPQQFDNEAKDKFSNDVPTGYGLSHGQLLEETLERLRCGSTVAPVPAEDCVATGSLIHALYASVENGGWVKLADKPISQKLGNKSI